MCGWVYNLVDIWRNLYRYCDIQRSAEGDHRPYICSGLLMREIPDPLGGPSFLSLLTHIPAHPFMTNEITNDLYADPTGPNLHRPGPNKRQAKNDHLQQTRSSLRSTALSAHQYAIHLLCLRWPSRYRNTRSKWGQIAILLLISIRSLQKF